MRVVGRRTGGDTGLSLVELLVTMVVASTIFPLVIGVVIAAQRNATHTFSTAESVATARRGLATIDRQVRSGAGPVLLHGSVGFGFRTTFTAAGAQAATPRCVQYRIDGGVLRTREYPANPTAPRPPWSSAPILASGLASGSAFDSDGGTSSVKVTLVLRQDTGRPAAITSVLTPRNSATSTDAAPCGVFS